MAAVEAGVGVAGAGFGVFEDGANDCLHVSADVVAVVGEDGGDARDVGRAGITGDEVLDELPADEGADVGVGEDVGECAGEVLLRGLAGGEGGAVEEDLGGGVVGAFDGGHGRVVIGSAVGKLGRRATGGGGVGPSGIGAGEGLDLGFGVDGMGLPEESSWRVPSGLSRSMPVEKSCMSSRA